jgi:hypothetical protein
LMQKGLVQGNFNAHFDIKKCLAVLSRVLRTRSYYRKASAALNSCEIRQYRMISVIFSSQVLHGNIFLYL